ncbi:YggS family pyridoxal phosphate-dependent enzyme [Aphanothece hegewaldii CCALA 016]|uniref:Pyridoxal phosphate homeostasis protein n=1 Tax=Aphanothece hegewaldii CCALA 016 TaxID=2107694 RepID=A0A2T1M040_9CHRO|nr:YggS family pyridoxal phosphate-dependent enzyme [Aphanothece hegewaldii]PSF37955.1 YggS family pyridoxal phosphate-dependent enzyme [Aphanothece hegewaldii CCALA 016]
MTIAQRIEKIRQSLPSHVRLIAVSKQVSAAAIREAYQVGVRDFGESRLQEVIPKQEQLKDLPDICWHFIGHLQANKAKKVLEHFQWLHSVDNLTLAQRLDRLATEMNISPQVCLQVKILSDPNKYGWETSQLLQDLPALAQFQQLKIQGLMTILPLGLSESEKLVAFNKTNELSQNINQRSHLSLTELSMGMSNDYLLAIRAGATMIRLGTILFGERQSI